jgi:hypothetical protein
MADAAHALNEAALIACDSGTTDVAERLCWQHIDAYHRAGPADSRSSASTEPRPEVTQEIQATTR